MAMFKDYAGPVFESLEDMAHYRITVQAPLFGDAVCPAADYTFSVSHDEGQTWRNPSATTSADLTATVAAAQGCCRNLGNACPAKIQARHMP